MNTKLTKYFFFLSLFFSLAILDSTNFNAFKSKILATESIRTQNKKVSLIRKPFFDDKFVLSRKDMVIVSVTSNTRKDIARAQRRVLGEYISIFQYDEDNSEIPCIVCDSTNETLPRHEFLRDITCSTCSQGWWCAQKRVLTSLLQTLKSLPELPKYLMVIDDDTFVNIPLLQSVIKDLDTNNVPEKEFHIGRYMTKTMPHGGAGHIISRAVLRRLVGKNKNFEPLMSCIEKINGGAWCFSHSDWSFGDCLVLNGFNLGITHSELFRSSYNCTADALTCHYVNTKDKYEDTFLRLFSSHTRGTFKGNDMVKCPKFVQKSWGESSEIKIAFVGGRFHSWNSFQLKQGDLGGEAYWAASMTYLLDALGVTVEFFDNYPPLNEFGEFHRLIFDGYAEKQLAPIIDKPNLLCKVRVLHYWGGGEWGDARINATNVDNRLILTPYMDPKFKTTPLPYFPHSLLTLPESKRILRNRSGYLLGKNCGYFGEPSVQNLLKALHDSDIDIHASSHCDSFPVPVIVEGFLSPSYFALMLREMSFVVGFGHPRVSPTPLEALANGAAFIDPNPGQHTVLSSIGPPYVYKYDIQNASSLLLAAELSFEYRFSSFIPSAHRVESALGTLCSNLLHNDAPCICASIKGYEYEPAPCSGSMYQTLH